MKRPILSCIAATAVLTTFVTFAWAADPVCIVGAGPAGLTVANRLEAKGYETVIFEKQPEVGGKCQAYYDGPGLFHPMGALLFENDTYHETLPIIDASGLSAMLFTNISDGRNWRYDLPSGHVQQAELSISDLARNPKFQAEIDRYVEFWKTEFAPLAVVGYKNGVQGYTMSTFDWLHENNYPLLLLLFIQGMVPFGYGDVTEVPVIYMLQYFTPDILLYFAGQQEGYIIDFHRVFVNYAHDHIKGPIHVNTTVTKIDRSGDFPVVSYNDPTQQGPSIQKCGKLVLAFPPVIHALNAANLDLDQKETAVFSPVGIIKYWSGAVQVITPYGDLFSGALTQGFFGVVGQVIQGVIDVDAAFRAYLPTLPEAAGYPMAFFRILSQSNIATTWSWGKYKSNQTLDEAKSLLKELLSKLNKDPRDPTAEPKPITDADVVAFREWDYFPHFDKNELENGFYAKFNELQGYKNTYYASGLNGFETVEFAIRAGQDVVDTYIL